MGREKEGGESAKISGMKTTKNRTMYVISFCFPCARYDYPRTFGFYSYNTKCVVQFCCPFT